MKCSISLSIYFSLEKYQTPSYRHAFCKTIGIPFGYSLLLSSAVTMRQEVKMQSLCRQPYSIHDSLTCQMLILLLGVLCIDFKCFPFVSFFLECYKQERRALPIILILLMIVYSLFPHLFISFCASYLLVCITFQNHSQYGPFYVNQYQQIWCMGDTYDYRLCNMSHSLSSQRE